MRSPPPSLPRIQLQMGPYAGLSRGSALLKLLFQSLAVLMVPLTTQVPMVRVGGWSGSSVGVALRRRGKPLTPSTSHVLRPGQALTLYWATSAAFSTLQNLLLRWAVPYDKAPSEERDKAALLAASAAATPVPIAAAAPGGEAASTCRPKRSGPERAG
jgi:hypothetical protein